MGRTRGLMVVVAALTFGCSNVRDEFTFVVDRSMFASRAGLTPSGVEVMFSDTGNERFFEWVPSQAETLPIRVLGADSTTVTVSALTQDAIPIGGSLPDRRVRDGSRVCIYSNMQLSECLLAGSRDCDCSPTDAMVTRDAMMDSGVAVADASMDAEIRRTEVSVASGADDAMQNPSANGGAVLVDHGWVSLYSPDHWGAVRFELPMLWSGATILSATLKLYADSGGADESTPNFRIHADTSAAPAPFSEEPYSISMRPRSSTFVLWQADAALGAGLHSSPGVEGLLQERVDDPEWNGTQSVVFILDTLEDTNDTEVCDNCFEFRTFEYPPGGGEFAAKLELQFTPPP